jgi:hypothetical protein
MAKIHIMLSGITFPVILMFFITGSLQMGDISTSSEVTKWRVKYATPLSMDLMQLKNIARQELEKRGFSTPIGKARLRLNEEGAPYKLSWEGINHDLVVRPSSLNNKVGVFRLDQHGWYARFWYLHQCIGNDVFDVSVIVFSVLLLLVLFFGIILGLQAKPYRMAMWGSLIGGFAIFALLVLISFY